MKLHELRALLADTALDPMIELPTEAMIQAAVRASRDVQELQYPTERQFAAATIGAALSALRTAAADRAVAIVPDREIERHNERDNQKANCRDSVREKRQCGRDNPKSSLEMCCLSRQ